MKLGYFCPLCEAVFDKNIKCKCGNKDIVKVKKVSGKIVGYSREGIGYELRAYGIGADIEERAKKRRELRKKK